jgi:hypothetical protein
MALYPTETIGLGGFVHRVGYCHTVSSALLIHSEGGRTFFYHDVFTVEMQH